MFIINIKINNTIETMTTLLYFFPALPECVMTRSSNQNVCLIGNYLYDCNTYIYCIPINFTLIPIHCEFELPHQNRTCGMCGIFPPPPWTSSSSSCSSFSGKYLFIYVAPSHSHSHVLPARALS